MHSVECAYIFDGGFSIVFLWKKELQHFRKTASRLVIAASFCIASFFLISSAAALFDPYAGSILVNSESSLMFRAKTKYLKSVDDPISRLYVNEKTRDQVVRFFAAITNSELVARAILDSSIQHEVRPSLAFAIAWVESRYNPRARSINASGSTNRGLFQLNSSVFNAGNEREIYDPFNNALLGIAHLKEYMAVSDDEFTALAAYNAGLNRISEKGVPGMTFAYISEISRMEQRILNFFSACTALNASL